MKTIEMGTKGANQRAKLLAAFAVIAMVVCALCVVVPFAEAADPPYEVSEGVATVDTYEQLTEAMSDSNVTSIMLGDDITHTDSNPANPLHITKSIDLNTHALSLPANMYKNGAAIVGNSSSAVTVSNGTFDVGDGSVIRSLSSAVITYDGVTFPSGAVMTNAAASITFKGCSFGTADTESSWGIYYSNNSTDVTVDENCMFLGTFDQGAIAVEGGAPVLDVDAYVPTLQIWFQSTEDLSKLEIDDANVGETWIANLDAQTALDSNVTVPGNDVVVKDSRGTLDKLTVGEDGTLNVKRGQTLEVPASTSVDNNGTIVNDGTIDNNGTLTNNKTLVNNGNTTGNAIEGTGTVVSPSDMEEMTVTGTAKTDSTFTADQIVVVDGTWTLVSGTDIIIEGQLVVPEGSQIIIEAGATLTINSQIGLANEDLVAADIAGSIFVDQVDVTSGTDYGLFKIENGTVSVSGSIDVYGNVTLTGTTSELVIEQDANMTVEATSNVTSESTIANYGVIDILGAFTAEVDNYSAVTINSDVAATGETKIHLLANGATVDVQNYTAGTDGSITIDDVGLTFPRQDAATATNNTITIMPSSNNSTNYDVVFSGITVVETVTQETNASGAREYVNIMDVSGSMAVSAVLKDEGTSGDVTPDADVSLNGDKRITVSGDLVVGEGIAVTNNGSLVVSGTVDAVAGSFANTSGETVDVSGDGEITLKGRETSINATINATRYTTGTGGDAVTHYVTVDTALATVNETGNTVTQLTVLGTQTVTVSATLPAGVTMDVSGATLVIGEENGSDVTLTVADGATVRGASTEITVNGTLYAENKRDIQQTTQSTIVSDVYSEEVDENGKVVRDGWARWTNIYTAMAGANPGDVITVNKDKDDGYVEITENLTIPTDVTLQVPAGKAPLLIMDGVTLTVDGTLTTEEDVYAETMFGTSAVDIPASGSSAAVRSSLVVVNGTLQTSVGAEYGNSTAATADDTYAVMSAGAPIYGAYYSVDGYSVISTLDIAVANVAEIEGEITVNGVVTVGDITFTGSETCNVIIIGGDVLSVDPVTGTGKIATVLTVGSLTIDKATVTANAALNGAVVVDDARLDLANVIGINVADDDGMIIYGAAVSKVDDANVRTGTIALSAGTATFGSDTAFASQTKVTVTVAAGATAVSNGASFNDIVVDGVLDITSATNGNKTVTANDMTVNATGSVEIASGEKAIINNDLTVYGTFAVATATSSTAAGTAQVTNMFIGFTQNDAKKGNEATTGTVSGPVTGITLAYVSSEATVDDAIQAVLDDKVKTEFMVENALWFTAYGSEEQNALTLPEAVPVANALLVGWTDKNGNSYTLGDNGTYDRAYTATADNVLTADVNRDIYTVYVIADINAVSSITIDGNMMYYGIVMDKESGQAFYAFQTIVAAGSHTVQYELANGYTGTGVLSVLGGNTTVSGTTFTTAGTETADMELTLQLTGFQKSGYVPDSPDTPSTPTSTDDGMTITDYLLIVLVVLIIVMAIIVAMRLMRS